MALLAKAASRCLTTVSSLAAPGRYPVMSLSNKLETAMEATFSSHVTLWTLDGGFMGFHRSLGPNKRFE